MKNKIILFFLSLTLAVTLGANTYIASAKNIPVASLKISNSSIRMTKSETFKLSIQVNPTKAKASVRWSTTNSAVAAVSGNGTVTAKETGSCTITAKSGNKTAKCAVTVRESFTDGKYKVGKDIPAGEYVLIGTGLNSDNQKNDFGTMRAVTSGQKWSLTIRGRSIVTFLKGDSVTIANTKMYPIAAAPKVDGRGILSEGMYKVGKDIAPGTYTLVCTDNKYKGYYGIYKNSLYTIVSKKKGDNFNDTVTVTLTSGEYVEVCWGQLQPLMSDSDYISYLNENYGGLTIGDSTISFDWHMTSSSSYKKVIYAEIDLTTYKKWCDLFANNNTSDITKFFNLMATAVKQNYPGKTYLCYVTFSGTFTDDPSSYFQPNEIKKNSDGTWSVEHIIGAFDTTHAPDIVQ